MPEPGRQPIGASAQHAASTTAEPRRGRARKPAPPGLHVNATKNHLRDKFLAAILSAPPRRCQRAKRPRSGHWTGRVLSPLVFRRSEAGTGGPPAEEEARRSGVPMPCPRTGDGIALGHGIGTPLRRASSSRAGPPFRLRSSKD